MLKLLAVSLLSLSMVLPAAEAQSSFVQRTRNLTIQGVTPGMRLQLFDGTKPVGAVTADDAGKAQVFLSSLVPGNHTIRSVERGTGKSAGAPLHVHVPARQAQVLAPGGSYATGLKPTAMAIEDLDGDGSADIVLAAPGSVAIMFNKSGVFGSPVPVADMAEPTGVVAVDLDGDGLTDLAISSANGTVTVLLNRGNGKFSAAKNWTVGASPSAIESADFNQDGVPDLAVSNRDGNTVSILLGIGNGSFKPAITAEVGHSPRSLVVADFDGDGNADLATANFGDNNISVLLGNGDGTFRNGTAFAVNDSPVSLRTGDFDEDGRADLVVLTQLGGSPSVLMNNGSGAFRNGTPLRRGSQTISSMAVGDFNGDGHADLLLQTGSEIHLQLGTGNGGFTDGNADSSAAPGLLVSLSDLDGDGRLDVVAVDMGGTLSVLSGTEGALSSVSADLSGSSVAKSMSLTPKLGGSTASGVVLASSANPASISQVLTFTATVTPSTATGSVTFYDGSTILGRIVVTGGQAVVKTPLGFGQHALKAFYTGSTTFAASSSAPLTQSVTAVAINGFQAPISFPLSTNGRSVATGDFNGDGKTDFVVSTSGTAIGAVDGPLQLFLNNGAGSFTQSTIGAAIYCSSIVTGDFNGDGITDLAAAVFPSATSQSQSLISIYIGNGNGTFQPAVSYTGVSSPYHITVGDLNNDGIADLVVPNKTLDTISVFLGKGDGTFNPAVSYHTTGDLAFFTAIADFDGDGNQDVVVTNNNTASLTLLLGKGDGTFKAPVNIVCRVEPYGIQVADLNGDGKMDMIVTSAHQFTVGVFMGNGDGTFQAPVYYVAGSEPHYFGATDFNGDGKIDLVVTDFLEAGMSVLLGNGDGTFQPKQTYYLTGPSGTPHEIAVADFNGDGAPDVVIADTNGKSVVIRYGNTSANTDVAMPNIFGGTTTQATAALQAAGLSAGATFPALHNPLVAGTVLDFLDAAGPTFKDSPNTGTLLPAGTAVPVVLSSGPGTISTYPIDNQTLATATHLLVEAGLAIGNVTSATSTTIQAGNIISQNPLTGTSVSTGTAVDVVVSTGLGGSLSVPNVVGLPRVVAAYAIQTAGFVVGSATTGTSSTVPAGSVISESPTAATKINGGSSVNLVVSSGAPALVAVPNVVGQTQAAATTAIQTANLVATITTASSTTVAAGIVISESPSAGAQVSSGSSVNLQVSSGPANVAIPNVIGQTQGAAITAIQTVHLAATVTTASSTTVAAGIVISESPTAGTQVSSGSSVNLVVSLGAAVTIPVPNVIGLTQTAATTAIQSANLQAGPFTSASSSTIAAGSVISENPAAGTQVTSGSSVALVISSGSISINDVSVTPSSGGGASQTFVAVYSDSAGAGAFNRRLFVITALPNGAMQECYVQVDFSNIFLASDDGTQLLGPVTSTTSVSNSQCTLNGPGTSLLNSGNTSTLTASITFKPAYSGPMNLLMWARDTANNITGWQVMGQFTAGGSQAGVSVPNVIGQTQAVALSAFQTAGLTVVGTTTASSNTIAAGSVISTNPSPGTLVSSGASVSLVISSGPPALRFIPVTPCRVADTRNAAGPFGGPSIAGGTTRDFIIPNSACGIPSTAQAYSLNVAVVPAGPLGFLTVWPSGQSQPLAATLNSIDGRIKSNAAIVPAGTGGAISVFASNATHVVLDINGYFVPATDPTALAFFPVTPCRIADTRQATATFGGLLAGGQSRTFPVLSSTCNIPATAQAYSLSLAAVPSGPLGFVSAWPTGQGQPLVASLNDVTGTVTANAAIVPAGAGGSIDIFASNGTNLVIDINGYFAPMTTGGLSLYNVTPCRELDTRLPAGSPPFSGQLDTVISGNCGVQPTAQAFVLNATVVPPGPLGFLTLWPQSQSQPLASTLNAIDAAITSNMAIVPTVNGSISAFASNPTHLILDIFGYFAP